MGLSSSKIKVLVVGLPGSGKSFFLDSLVYGTGSTNLPTQGFYEVGYKDIVLTEYGGQINWIRTLNATGHVFHAVYFVISSSFSKEEICESNNALLMLDNHFDETIPFCIVWNGDTCQKLKFKPANCRPIYECYLDFCNSFWLERVWELLEWTTVSSSTATRPLKRNVNNVQL